jgi:hypothetical protein
MTAEPSQISSLLAGAPLPARRDELVAYAEEEGADEEELAALRALPDREYESAADVGDALRPVEPQPPAAEPAEPSAQSGEPPGGPAYTA